MKSQRVIGIAGWSGSGKTTLIEKLIMHLSKEGRRVGTIKHAHHDFDIDIPGKDSHIHRTAGATQVLVSSSNRWALVTELRGSDELSFENALKQLTPQDLVLVEGFKASNFPKLEIYRKELGKPPLYGTIPGIIAVASDCSVELDPNTPLIDLNDFNAILHWVKAYCAWSS